MPRYNKYRILNNASDYYAPLRESRDVKNIRHYETPQIHNPTLSQRVALLTTTHIWKYGDRFYKLADKHYNDARFWWVIAWYNSAPTEASLITGDPLEIPVNLEKALKVLGIA
ncbi:hypothetical protein CMI47_21350 [Candidatus Pacearchaeota archaeon]|nr:hypothetical protein [Candidatus Pacearchaeota archaeon]|tara:strand:- start:431 stop:769 length:339 start_codon:yes stop_codon:yes gene_type:complete